LKQERIDSVLGKYPTIEGTTKLAEILQDSSIDAVAVATPVSAHFPLAKQVLAAGKHVLVEKPMTATVKEAEELVKLAKEKKKILMVDHTFIYNGAVRKMKELIDKGEVGDLLYYDSVRINLGLFQHDVNVVWDLAPHDFSIMNYLLGKKPEYLVAIGTAHYNTDLENIAYVTVKFEGNVIAHVHVSWLAPVKIRTTLVGGTKKMIVYDENEPSEKIKVYDKGVDVPKAAEEIYKAKVAYRYGDMYAPQFDRAEPLAAMVGHFADCIEKGNPPLTDGKAGLDVVRLLEASEHSIKNSGKKIDL
jgi:predicted dehydrogenase